MLMFFCYKSFFAYFMGVLSWNLYIILERGLLFFFFSFNSSLMPGLLGES